MNIWVQKSINIANSPGYLDKLSQVYEVTPELERAIPSTVKQRIKHSYDQRDSLTLIKVLLALDKFPIKDPYVAFLRKKRGAFIMLNPKTVNRIAQRIFSMSFDEVIRGCEEPKEFNRQIGTLFGRWLPKMGFPVLSKREFDKYKGIALLGGTNGERKDYANRVLRCNLDKGPDLLAKVDDKYIIGEAKFLTDYGGHQNAQFQDALRLLRGKEGDALRVAILDGVLWIRDRARMYRIVSQLKENVLTALLLKDFLESLR